MRYLPVILLYCLFVGCSSDETATVPAPATPILSDNPIFEELPAAQTGIDFANIIREDYQTNILTNSYLYNGGGVGILDFDQDGLMDVYLSSTQGTDKLYRNLGDLKFQDVSQTAGIEVAEGFKTGVSVADVNADGYPDIYVSRTDMKTGPQRRNLLFINDQDGTFTESAEQYGIADESATNHANFFDYDLDGDLDLYLVNYPVDFKSVNAANVQEVNGVRTRVSVPRDRFDSDRLYRNDGGKFTDVSEAAGIQNRAFGLSVTASDFNDDGYPDLFVGNDYIEPDMLYLNNRDGTFREASNEYFTHTSNHTMGVDMADLDGDGYRDLVALDMLAPERQRRQELMTTMNNDRYGMLARFGYGNQLMQNTLQLGGRSGFRDAGTTAGIAATDWSWAPLLADFNNDGLTDVYITNGYRRDVSNLDYLTYTSDSVQRNGGINPRNIPDLNDYLDLIPSIKLTNQLFLNEGDLGFKNISQTDGTRRPSYSNGAAYADLDNDGDLDLIVNNIDMPAFVYRNRTDNRNFLRVKLNDPMAANARVEVYLKDRATPLLREASPYRGYLSSVDPVLHFGLPDGATIERVRVLWPDRTTTETGPIKAGQTLELDKTGSTTGKSYLPKGVTATLTPLPFRHRENAYDDFGTERLLPYALSGEGPALAAADVNGDGQMDYFVGGASGQESILLVATGNSFDTQKVPGKASKEATAATFFDADGDGDQDLYIGYGGNETPLSVEYSDELLRNDGRGTFSQMALQPGSPFPTSAVVANDLDGDGQAELFVAAGFGGQKFPQTAGAKIYRISNNTLTDVSGEFDAVVTAENRPIHRLVLADVQGDAPMEVIAVGPFGTPRIFGTTGGKFGELNTDFGDRTGWWQTVLPHDVDGDGLTDLLVGNLGTNLTLATSMEHPLRLYAADVDRNGSIDPFLAEYDGSKYVPVVGLGEALKQAPPLKKKYQRNAAYSKASIEDLLGADAASALQLSAAELRSGWFRNTGNGFEFQPFPTVAQLSAVRSIVPVNVQGSTQFLLLGNRPRTAPYLGRLDANRGTLLRYENGRWLVTEADLGITATVANALLTEAGVLLGINDGELMELRF